MALLLANGSMSSNTNNEGEIRKAGLRAKKGIVLGRVRNGFFRNGFLALCNFNRHLGIGGLVADDIIAIKLLSCFQNVALTA